MPGDIGVLAAAAVLTAASAPLTKLIEVVASGIGGLAQPVITILQAHAEGKAHLIRLGYQRQADLLEGRHTEQLQALPSLAPLQLPSADIVQGEVEVIFARDEQAERARANFAHELQVAKRRANASAIAGEAADNLGENVSSEPVDADWVGRFFASGQDVSSAGLQKLWGKLLAREVEKPGTVPLRTLDILRNLSRSEADLVKKLTRYMMREPRAYLHVNAGGLSEEELTVLQDIGVLFDGLWLVDSEYDDQTDPEDRGAFRHRASISFPSGHSLVISSLNRAHLQGYLARPGAFPILDMLSEETNLDYVREICRGLDDLGPCSYELHDPD